MSYAPNPEALRSAFAAERFTFEETPVQFSLAEAGRLVVSSCKIAAGDPHSDPAPEPFTQCLPNGEYPVTLATARFDNGEERLAYARVMLADSPVVHWYPALTAGQDARALQPDEVFGFTVESGNACFMTADGAVSFPAASAGRYPSYFGYDSSGRVAGLLTDFDVIPGVRAAPLPRRSWWQRMLSFLK